MRRWAAAAGVLAVLAIAALTAWWTLDGGVAAVESSPVPDGGAAGPTESGRPAPRARAASPAAPGGESTKSPTDETSSPPPTEPRPGGGPFLFPVAIRVVDGKGEPVGGAYVSLFDRRSAVGVTPTTTDAQGRVRFEDRDVSKSPRGFEVTVRASGFVESKTTAWAGSDEFRIVLQRHGRIEGVVVDDEGRPVHDAYLHAMGARGPPDGQGRFALDPAEPGEGAVIAVAGKMVQNAEGGYEPVFSGATQIVLGDGETLRDVRVVLSMKRSFVTAEVVEEDGSRGAAEQVRLEFDGRTRFQPLKPTATFEVPVPAGTPVRLQAVSHSARSGGNDRSATRRVTVLDTVTDAAPGDVRRLVLVRPVRATIRVLGANGAPVTFPCSIEIVEDDPRLGSSRVGGDAGVVELLVAPAKRLRGFVHADTVRGAPFDLDPPGAEGRSYDLTLPAMAVVRGRVTGPTGAPLAGHPVTIYEGRRHVSSWRTAADGGFEFLGLPDGAYRLAVLPPEGSSPLPRRRDPAVAGRDVRIEGARDVDLGTISAWTQTKLRGRVVGPGGKPVAAACVSLTAPLDGRRVESATDRDGRFEIEWFAGAPTELTVERPGLATEARRLESGAGGAEDLEIRLVPGGAVRVLFADANWIASSALRVRRAAGGPDWYVFGGGGGTAPQVLVLLRDLPADDLILSIFVDGREIERRVTVRAGETTEVRIDREP